VALRVLPNRPQLEPGATLALRGEVLDDAGGVTAVSLESCLSGDPAVVQIEEQSRLVAQSYGVTEVRCNAGDLEGSTAIDVVPGDRYSDVEIDYLGEIAFSDEFGDSGLLPLRRWEADVTVAVYGDPTEEDLLTVAEVIEDLNQAIDTIEVSWVTEDPDIDIHFVPLTEFTSIEPGAEPGNHGLFWIWWDATYRLYTARVLIATDVGTQATRNHLIREELTQSFGIPNDSLRYPDSIFYQNWTETQAWATVDWLVVEMVYHAELSAGMTIDEATLVLRGLRRP
jgi:hypothetical protein